MRALRFALLALLRDWRSGELAVLLAALLVAVTALTGVGFFTDRIGQAVDQRAAEVIAADLRMRSAEPLSADYDRLAAEDGIATARTVSFPSVVYFGAESALTAIRAVGPGYPLRGRIKISDAPFEAARETSGLPGRGEAWLDSRLLARIGAGIGDRVSIGAAAFKVTQVLDYRPDQGSAFVDLAPSLLIPLADLESTGLLGPGSRATYSLLFAGKPAGIRAFRVKLQERKAKSERLVGVSEESPQIQSSTKRAGRFLNLSAMITVLLAAVAVAMAARRYTERHLDNVALMKCMGAPQSLVLWVTVIELALIALIAAIVGSALGYLAQELLTRLLGDLVRADLPPPDARARDPGPGDGARDPRGICAAADAAVEARTAGARAAPQPGTAAAALLAFLWACHCRAARRAVLAGAGREARRLPGGRNRRHARGALWRGILARAPRRAPARRGRCRMALWRREPGAPRAGECRAGRRFRARADGAPAARRRSQRPHAGLAGEPAGGHAQLSS